MFFQKDDKLMETVAPVREEKMCSRSNAKAAQPWAAFCSRENSSNGSEAVKTFLQKSYEPTRRGVKRFFPDKCHCFQ